MDTSPTRVLYLIPFLFPVVFIGLWCLTAKILSTISGWMKLATHFRFSGVFDGQRYHFQSGRMNGVQYSGALEIGVTIDGLYLIPFFLFRLFHPALLIPWDAIQADPKPIKRFWFTMHRLTFPQCPGVYLEVYESMFTKMRSFLQKNSDTAFPEDELS